eukprot:ANDGO_07167.mRNA.1 hypothetical protein H310_08884
MGGLVARTMCELEREKGDSLSFVDRVFGIFTLSTPHRGLPVYVSRSIAERYEWLHRRVRNPAVPFVTVSGGVRDTLIGTHLVSLFDDDLHAIGSNVDGVYASLDHRCIMWCMQFLARTNAFFRDLSAPFVNNELLVSMGDEAAISRAIADGQFLTQKHSSHFLSLFRKHFMLPMPVAKPDRAPGLAMRKMELDKAISLSPATSASYSISLTLDDTFSAMDPIVIVTNARSAEHVVFGMEAFTTAPMFHELEGEHANPIEEYCLQTQLDDWVDYAFVHELPYSDYGTASVIPRQMLVVIPKTGHYPSSSAFSKSSSAQCSLVLTVDVPGAHQYDVRLFASQKSFSLTTHASESSSFPMAVSLWHHPQAASADRASLFMLPFVGVLGSQIRVFEDFKEAEPVSTATFIMTTVTQDIPYVRRLLRSSAFVESAATANNERKGQALRNKHENYEFRVFAVHPGWTSGADCSLVVQKSSMLVRLVHFIREGHAFLVFPHTFFWIMVLTSSLSSKSGSMSLSFPSSHSAMFYLHRFAWKTDFYAFSIFLFLVFCFAAYSVSLFSVIIFCASRLVASLLISVLYWIGSGASRCRMLFWVVFLLGFVMIALHGDRYLLGVSSLLLAFFQPAASEHSAPLQLEMFWFRHRPSFFFLGILGMLTHPSWGLILFVFPYPFSHIVKYFAPASHGSVAEDRERHPSARAVASSGAVRMVGVLDDAISLLAGIAVVHLSGATHMYWISDCAIIMYFFRSVYSCILFYYL